MCSMIKPIRKYKIRLLGPTKWANLLAQDIDALKLDLGIKGERKMS